MIDILPDLISLQWPSKCLDLSCSPSLCAPCPPDLPYARYELIRTFLECYRTYPDLGDSPASCQATLDQLPEDTLKAYHDFYAATHPKCMDNVINARQTAIKTVYISRT